AAVPGDRYRRELVLTVGYLIQAVAMLATGLAILLSLTPIVVYAFAAAAATSITLTRPIQGALMPSLARSPDELTAANVASGTVESFSIMAGPILAGLLLPGLGSGAVYLGAAAMLFAGAGLVVGIRPDDRRQPAVVRAPGGLAGTVLKEGLQGFRRLAADPSSRAVVSLLAGAWMLWGALDVFAVMLAIDLLGIGDQGAGFLTSAVGVGGLVGAVATVLLIGDGRLTIPIAIGIALWGLPLALLGSVPVPLVAFGLIALAGAGRTILDVASRTLLQRVAADEVLARVFGILEAAQMAALAVGSIAAPILVLAFGQRGALVIAGLSLPLLGMLSWRRIWGSDRPTLAPRRSLELLRGQAMFARLEAPILERLAGALRPFEFAAGNWVIRQGEPGDFFYVIDEGTVEVSIDGRFIRNEGPGEAFGEIALLLDVPRTASVRAVSSVRLLALDRAIFLASVGGYAGAHAAAAELSATGPATR
ncbi:MAG: cyclic nucleotide-binding domain-containing protein, partial [Candidatus Limnocylindrales bacterium]